MIDVRDEWVQALTKPHGFYDPIDVMLWREFAGDPDEARAWKDAGFGPDEAHRWIPAGWSPEEAKDLMAAVDEHDRMDLSLLDGAPWPEIDDWIATGLPPTRVILCVKAGLDLAEAMVIGHDTDALRTLAALRGHVAS